MFSNDIIRFNKMYKLPVASSPALDQGAHVDPLVRLVDFKKILLEEIDEIDDIIAKVGCYQANEVYFDDDKPPYVPTSLEVLTDIADLLGDIQVYCASEMAKFGLPLNEVLAIIMESNFSKLGADGLPIYDERGKVQKGPNYWKPEPRISSFLHRLISNAASVKSHVNFEDF